MFRIVSILATLIFLSSCQSLFQTYDYNRADDILTTPQVAPVATTSEYYEEETSQNPASGLVETEDGYEYFDPNYQVAEPFNSPFMNNQSFNAFSPMSSSLWLSPSIAYWNRQASWNMGMGMGMGMGNTFGMGSGFGMNPYMNSWQNPMWNPYSTGLYNPWFGQPSFGFMQPSMYNPYYNQWMMPGWGVESNRSPVYYQRRNNINRRTNNVQYTPGRNVTNIGSNTKRGSRSNQQYVPPANNRIKIDPNVNRNSNTRPGNRSGRSTPNKVNWAQPTRSNSPNRSTSPSRSVSPSRSNFSSPSRSISSPSRSSSPVRSTSPSRRR